MSGQERFERSFSLLKGAVDAGRIPGGVLGIVEPDGSRITRAIGWAQKVPMQRPMRESTWFDLASLTKVIFTTPRILKLVDDGMIDLDAPLDVLLPDFRQYNVDAWERKMTVRECLGHQTPLPGVEPIYTYGTDPNTLRHFVLQREWRAGPSVYSDINYILLGIVLERLNKATIRNIDPGKGFDWSADRNEVAATEHCLWRNRVLAGEVHDENCAALQGSGHAGLFGTVSSVLDFARGLIDGTAASAQAIELMRTPISGRRTHGWEKPYEGWSGGEFCSAQTIGHTGFTGTGLWIDFEAGRTWTLLTNRVHPSRHFDSGIFALRRAIGDAVNDK